MSQSELSPIEHTQSVEFDTSLEAIFVYCLLDFKLLTWNSSDHLKLIFRSKLIEIFEIIKIKKKKRSDGRDVDWGDLI